MFSLLLCLLLIPIFLQAELIDQSAAGLGDGKVQEFESYNWFDRITPDNDAYVKNLLAEVDSEHNPTNFVVLSKIPEWLVESSLANMPLLLRGIFNYLKFHDPANPIASCHRFILVGKPGVGKTTLAQSIAHSLGYGIEFVHASSLFGKYRNHTAINLRELFDRIKWNTLPKVLIIDEIHKLFENHEEDRTDDAASATAFWNQLDEIEKNNPNIVVIGTANGIDKLPPEIKSRFHGKMIEMSMPDLKQRRDALQAMLKNDSMIELGLTINERFLDTLNKGLKSFSLRDIQLLIDTAKMFKYADLDKTISKECLVLERTHFEKALQVLESEDRTSWQKRMEYSLKKLSPVVHMTAELGFIISLFAAGGKVGAGYLQTVFSTTKNI